MKYYWMLLYLINCAEEERDYEKIVAIAEEMTRDIPYEPIDFESEAYGIMLSNNIHWKKIVDEMLTREGEIKKMGERYKKLVGDVKSEDMRIVKNNNLFGDSCLV